MISVLPPDSCKIAGVPEKMINLMIDKKSKLKKYFPKLQDVKLDLNMKKSYFYIINVCTVVYCTYIHQYSDASK